MTLKWALWQDEKGDLRRGRTMKERIYDDFLAVRGAGSITSLSPPFLGKKIVRNYLMLISWASISSVVVMILELAW